MISCKHPHQPSLEEAMRTAVKVAHKARVSMVCQDEFNVRLVSVDASLVVALGEDTRISQSPAHCADSA